MQLLSDFKFFAYAAILIIPAVILGLREKPIKYYGFCATAFFLIMAMKDSPTALIYMAGYCGFQYVLVKTFATLVDRKGRNGVLFGIYILLSLAPLMVNKIAGLFAISILGFLGISYMTFKSIQMIIEIYDGIIKEVDFFEFINFLLFFPSVTSGPIDRSRRFGEDFNRIIPRNEYLEMVGEGLFKICLGMFYKFVAGTAVYQAVIWLGKDDTVRSAVLYMYSYGFYLFFDFAGYSLMAVGLGYIFGIKLPDNFNKPFISKDIKEFWDRWHISLSHWFRDFVFSRFMMKAIRNKWFKSKLTAASWGFIINMSLMGVWHGLNIYYVLYGLYHGILLAVTEVYQKKSKFHKKHKKERWYMISSWFITFNLVMFGFFIFSGRFTELLTWDF